ncbi:MAG: vWA domain-containing protein [Phycisphaerales bacterium]
MTLLTPLPAIIAAAIAVPALLALYFLKLRRKSIRVSSILLWERAERDTEVNVPFRMIRPSWLLAMQLLALALLLLALGRPVIHSGATPAERTIIVIDRSASMSASASPGAPTRLAQALVRARAAVRAAPSGARVGVISFAATARVECDLTPDRARALDAIAAIRPTDQAGAPAAALALAADALSAAEDDGPRPSGAVVLVTDATPTDLTARVADAPVRAILVGDDAAENLGIVALAARRDDADPVMVRVLARVATMSSTPTLVTVRVLLDGREADSRAVEVMPISEANPGGDSLTFSLPTREGGVLTVRLDRADALAADNEASVVLATTSKPRVVVVIPDGEPAASAWIITEVLEALALPTRVVSQAAYQGDQPPAELVIFDRTSPGSLPPCASLSLGRGVPGLQLRGVNDATGTRSGGRVLSWRRDHPLLRGVSLDGVYVARSLPWADQPRAELVTGPDGPLIALTEDHARRVVVAFEPAQSNWPLTAGFSVFIASAVDYLTLRASRDAGSSARTSESSELIIPADSPRRLTLVGPERVDLSAVPRVPRESGRTSLALAPLERAGIYRAEGAPGVLHAVNLVNLGETLLSAGDVPTEQTAGASRTLSESSAASSRRSARRNEPVELLPWLLLAVLVLTTVEYALSARRLRA